LLRAFVLEANPFAMKSCLFILLLFSLPFFSCNKQEAVSGIRQDQLQAIEKLIERKRTSVNIPGIAVAVIKNGIAIKTIVSGFANIEMGVSVQVSTPFQLASTTKSFLLRQL
jgi:CubicO group peptidase (beta-lactamase class C family)